MKKIGEVRFVQGSTLGGQGDVDMGEDNPEELDIDMDGEDVDVDGLLFFVIHSSPTGVGKGGPNPKLIYHSFLSLSLCLRCPSKEEIQISEKPVPARILEGVQELKSKYDGN